MSKIILKGYIVVPDDELEQIVLELSCHIERTRAEPGCIVFEVERDPECSTRFNVYEEFIDQNAFDKHQENVRNSKWGQITGNVSRHYEVYEES